MEKIANDFLERGDVASALPILSTLALAAGSNAEQRRRRLLHARIHREASAVMHCVAGQPLREEQRAAICDAILDVDVPSAVLFGRGNGAEATKRLQTLRLAVHPDKCSAPRASEAITRLHDRKAEHADAVTAADAEAAESSSVSTPATASAASPHERRPPSAASPVASPKARGGLQPTTQPAASPTCASPNRSGSPKFTAASPKAGRFPPFPSASPLAATTGRMAASPQHTRAASPAHLGRTAPANKRDDLRSLLSGFRSTSNVKLQSDLSYESCSGEAPCLERDASDVIPTMPRPPAAAAPVRGLRRETPPSDDHDERLRHVLSNTVASEFDRARNALLEQLAHAESASPVPASVDDAVAATLSEAFTASFEAQARTGGPTPQPVSQRTTVSVKRSVVVRNDALLPVIRPRRRDAGR
mmetsp:Transcript_46177/g.142369  ORF Transcript_46177/g.142369 Transcript_46177/m.142369 type:complete len:419 (-) Transcript_46177:67-1323(-)|eukprot:CAMPEP_0174853850 /NCGR_PEP_ID=MMETSP1114-20130205/29605_1 /TAXON_ID=312471 /ORGANISM="Neobodo designis, Strain CCAP 1951/1" /LENGTH=418 /DNA_ID=CAMNT_0016088519 /DNA_START=56 /DNA_END=1312 /DNA_ORIENTATION=-